MDQSSNKWDSNQDHPPLWGNFLRKWDTKLRDSRLWRPTKLYVNKEFLTLIKITLCQWCPTILAQEISEVNQNKWDQPI